MDDSIRITVLVENSAINDNLKAQHGLSVWIECGDKKILFDTGQNGAIVPNAGQLGVDLSRCDAVVLSHGHYDHTGGLPEVLKITKRSKLFFHPGATEPKYHPKNNSVKQIGITDQIRELLIANKESSVYTEEPVEIEPGILVTGPVPRENDFEDTGGNFYLDADCSKEDPIIDDQSLVMDSEKGLIIILGCAHSGVVNTLDYISNLKNDKKIHLVLGGMHLASADQYRLNKTIEALDKYDIDMLYPCHCTGQEVIETFRAKFGSKCRKCSAGTEIFI